MEATLKTRPKKAAFTVKERESIYNIFETYQKEQPKLKKKDWLSYTAKTAGVCESSVVKIVREKESVAVKGKINPKLATSGKKAIKRKPKVTKRIKVWATSRAEASEIANRIFNETKMADEPKCFEDFFDQIWKTPSLIKLPSPAWAIHKIANVPPVPNKDNVITFTEMAPTPDDNVYIKKKIVINRTASIEFYFNNIMMDGLFFMPEIGTVTELQAYLNDFHENY